MPVKLGFSLGSRVHSAMAAETLMLLPAAAGFSVLMKRLSELRLCRIEDYDRVSAGAAAQRRGRSSPANQSPGSSPFLFR